MKNGVCILTAIGLGAEGSACGWYQRSPMDTRESHTGREKHWRGRESSDVVLRHATECSRAAVHAELILSRGAVHRQVVVD